MYARLLHLLVMAALVSAAVHVYRIKFESTVRAERVAKLRAEIRKERDTIAALQAQWAQLDNPARIQALAQRHLGLKAIEPTQIDSIDHLPERPEPVPTAQETDAVGSGGPAAQRPTGTMPPAEKSAP
jgi:cell division protein FtsL